MGVPKFYRFISDRYPSINKTVKEYEIPQYDNLYLDMNSIVHTCSHPSDSDVHFRIGKKEFSDEDIFQNVCRYVEIIFSIVKPVDVMYLAFDGVAPRAKMNQQRSHRFRVAKGLDEAAVKNGMLQDDTLFDANCITTGTAFMAELIDSVKHFVAFKISTDLAWQKCKIIVSGPEVPGEGEHKIMEFIRYKKAQSNYNPNTRHCLYSLDADLIILGLCTHEPHFSLIREKVTFGKRKNMLTPEESDFHLLHLSLLREYLEYEFSPMKSKLKFQFNLEKIIDDWVLIGFLVGNDFIPQLPSLNIVDGALPLLYQTYMEVLPTLDGYINEYGDLNVTRFKSFIAKLSEFETNYNDPHNSTKISVNQSEIKQDSPKDDSKIKVLDFSTLQQPSGKSLEARKSFIETAFKLFGSKHEEKKEEHSRNVEPISVSSSNDKTRDASLSESIIVKPCREEYYKNKLKFDQVDRSKILALVEHYIKAVQWTLKYYYQGCCSWSWYYPYHYAPLISDIENLENVNFDFTMGKPFLPLQHLLAVLPPANVHLLPKPLHFLLTNQTSPIIEFYPNDFEIDLNDKTNDWESTVLIPFIDENKLINAMEPYVKSLNSREKKRNSNGSMCIFIYTKMSLGQYPVETIFDSFENHAQLERMKIEDMYIPRDKLIQGLCKNVSFNLSFPGFPSLKHINHSFSFETKKSICNTHHLSNVERMIFHVSPKPAKGLEDLAKEFLGQTVYSDWPYLEEVYVIGITDFKKKIILKNFWKKYSEDNIKNDQLAKSAMLHLHEKTKLITETYGENFGIDIGQTDVLFYVFPMMGKKYACVNGKTQLQPKWSPSSKVFPYQLIVKNEEIERFTCVLYKSINDLFIESSTCFMISQPNYGAKGEVKSVLTSRKQLIAVTLELPLEPDFSSSKKEFFAASNYYFSSSEVAQKLNVNSTLINRITGSLIVMEDPLKSKCHNIGLRIKLSKKEKELFGYTKKNKEYWSYSDKAIELIQNYMKEFPYLFENLCKNVNSSTFTVSELFPDGLGQLNLLKVWLSEQEVHYTTFVDCHTKTLGLNGVPKLEKFIDDFYSKEHKKTIVTTQVPPQSLFTPGTLTGLVPIDFKADHNLLDRVICVRNNFTVPIGLEGTIIGIQEKEEKWKSMYEVLFDSPFTGGLTLYDSSDHRCYRLTASDFINISFGKRDARNSKPPRSEPPSKTVKNNGTDNTIKQPNNSSKKNNGNNGNVRFNKTGTLSRNANNSNRRNERTSNNLGEKKELHKTNDETRKLKVDNPKKKSRTKMAENSRTLSNVNQNEDITESVNKNSTIEAIRNTKFNNTGNRFNRTKPTRSKAPFDKENRNRPQRLTNQKQSNANINKTTTHEKKETKNRNAEKKLCDSKEDEK